MKTSIKEGEDITKNIHVRQQTTLNPNFVLQSKVNAFNF